MEACTINGGRKAPPKHNFILKTHLFPLNRDDSRQPDQSCKF